MATRIEYFEVTTPSATLRTAPQRTALNFPEGVVTDIEVLVPPGPSGLMGFRFEYGGAQIIPKTPGEFVISDDEVIKWPIEKFPTGRQWELVTFNIDVFEHAVHVRFLVNEFGERAAPAPEIAPIPGPGQETEEEAIFEIEREEGPVDRDETLSEFAATPQEIEASL